MISWVWPVHSFAYEDHAITLHDQGIKSYFRHSTCPDVALFSRLWGCMADPVVTIPPSLPSLRASRAIRHLPPLRLGDMVYLVRTKHEPPMTQ